MELVDPTVLFDEITRIHGMLSRRAFEIFEREGSFPGRELDHWLRPESEFLHPVPLKIEEMERELVVEAEVPGFIAGSLKVSLEPRKLIISGKRELRKGGPQGKKPAITETGSDEILRIVELPVEVDVLNTVAVLREGILELKMPKAKPAKVVEIKVA